MADDTECPYTALRIFPPIGLGRVGTAKTEYFLAPEVPYQASKARALNKAQAEKGKEEDKGKEEEHVAHNKEAALFAPLRYKDRDGGLKPQAVRYRIYAEALHPKKNDKGEDLIEELNLDNEKVKSIEWHVHVANKKSSWNGFFGQEHLEEAARNPRNPLVTDVVDRKAMEIDPGAKILSVCRQDVENSKGDGFCLFERNHMELIGTFNCGSLDPTKVKAGRNHAGEEVESRQLLPDSVEVNLGALNADKSGRLLFFPGTGEMKTHPKEADVRLLDEFNNFNCYDNACDGPIHAVITFVNGTKLDTSDWKGHSGAWIITAPPNYAPELNSVTSMVDIAVDATIELVEDKKSPGEFRAAVPYPGLKTAGVRKDSPLSGYPLAYEEYNPGENDDKANIGYYRHIFPMMAAATGYSWTNMMAYTGHAPGRQGDFVNEVQQNLFADPSKDKEVHRKNFFFRMRGFDRKDSKDLFQNRDALFNSPDARPPISTEEVKKKQLEAEAMKVGEAKKYFMPRLGGNDGGFEDFTATDKEADGSPGSFFAMLPAQMTKLRKWSDGLFYDDKEEESYKTLFETDFLENVGINEQPDALILGALLPLVGGSFHPGMEYTFISRLSQYYCEPFRFNYGKNVYLNSQRAVLTPGDKGQELGAGDITKWMALPWHSDFYGCRLIWWPSNRPDTVVTEKYYKEVMGWRDEAIALKAQGNDDTSKETKKFLDKVNDSRKEKVVLSDAAVDASTALVSLQPLTSLDTFDDISTILTHRVMWDRGLHTLPVAFKHVANFPKVAFEDMANDWHRLGFVLSETSGSGTGTREYVYVEAERDPTMPDFVQELEFAPSGDRIVEKKKEEKESDNLKFYTGNLFKKNYWNTDGAVGSDDEDDENDFKDDDDECGVEGDKYLKKKIDTLEDLQEHLLWGIDVEMLTIPLYLSSLYALRENPLDPLSGNADGQTEILRELGSLIRSVVVEEMLHLVLAMNVYIAIGGELGDKCPGIEQLLAKANNQEYKPHLHAGRSDEFFWDKIIIKYPIKMPHHDSDTAFNLHLGKPDSVQMKTFLKIEEPKIKKDEDKKFDCYETIAQLYDSIIDGMDHLINVKGDDIFSFDDPEEKERRLARQLGPGVGYAGSAPDAGRHGGGILTVSNLEEAKNAIETIILQGEGSHHDIGEATAASVRTFLDDTKNLTKKDRKNLRHLARHPKPFDKDNLELSHFQRFFVAYGVVKTFPENELMYPVIRDACTQNLKKWGLDNIYQLSLAFDAVFTYQLDIIEHLYDITNPKHKDMLVKGGLFTVMLSVTGALGRLLCRTEFQHEGKTVTAGCAFQRYDWKPADAGTRKEQMVKEVEKASGFYMADLAKALEVAQGVLDIDVEISLVAEA